MIVGFPAGGGTDVTARVLAEALRGAYASTVLVENKPGASARIAVEYREERGARRQRDAVHAGLSDDALSAQLQVAELRSVEGLHAGRSGHHVDAELQRRARRCRPASRRSADYVQWCKANPDKASYGTTSAGATPHFAGVMLSNESKVTLNPVHYRGGAPALQDVVGGHIPMSVNPLSEALPLHQGGTIRALAVTGAKRSQFMPNVPTAKESGYDVVVESWLGVFLPPKAPADVVRALSNAMKQASESSTMKDNLAKFASTATFQTPEQFIETIKADLKRWGPVVKASGFVAVD